jgi:predicted O-linked N-acetylglucosamine transferase (SPINDLY family)
VSATQHLEQARAYLSAGDHDRAMVSVRQALAAEPENLTAMLLIARLVRHGGKIRTAEGMYRTIIDHHASSAEALAGLAACCGLEGRYEEAVEHLRQAVALVPEYFEAWAFLGEALVEQGRTTEAMDCFERSLAIRPFNAAALSKQLFYAVFDPRYDAARIAELNRAWGRRVADLVQPLPLPPSHHSDIPIRIGYLSDEFYERVTTRFMTPVLAHHDRSKFHVTCYARNATQDETTTALQTQVDSWRDIADFDDRSAAQAIRDDGIDILIICTSYRVEARTLLAYKPASVQVCYSNLVSTTGLDTVDYLITENATDPDGSDRYYTEKLVRIENRNIYQPPDGAPEPGPLPLLKTGSIRFASFNNLGKISPNVVAVWSRILHALPSATLALKSVNRLRDPGARDYFIELFASHGIEAGRLELKGGDTDLKSHLTQYQSVDIALDPFPCNGGTTSCEALWMGVPVVTMAGDTFMGRQGVNYLGKLGLEDLVATDADTYFAVAVALAENTERLSGLRARLRTDVATKLFDPQSHVAELETAFREMWRRYRHGEAPAAFRVQRARVLA